MTIAFYLRLSEADRHLYEEEKDESNSIENQRLLLYSFIETRDDLTGEVKEYVDDGYTGTNYDRPSFQRMIEDAKKGKIQVILVKDLSRLGRDYITTSDYINQIFPLLGLRFIAVTSNYDSSVAENNPNMDFDMAVSNIINTFYSRDISKKIRSNNHTLWKNGLTTTGIPVFGYVKDPENPKRWVIDPVAGKIVRRMFELAISGMSTLEIAEALNDEGLPTPGVYYKSKKWRRPCNFVTKEDERLWSSAKVSTYLKRRDYTGAMIMGRTTTIKVGDKRTRKVPEDKWYVHKGVNEAIVSEDEFIQAQKAIKPKIVPEFTSEIKYALKGKIRCGNCYCCLSYQKKKAQDYYYCSHPLEIGSHCQCNRDKYPVEIIDGIVLAVILDHLSILKRVGLLTEKKVKTEIQSIKHMVTEDRTLADRLRADKIRQYEAYADGLISKEEYLRKKQELSAKIEVLDARDKAAQQLLDDKKDMLETSSEMVHLANKFESETKLTRPMVEHLIANVYVENLQRLRVEFLFDDKIREYTDSLTQVE